MSEGKFVEVFYGTYWQMDKDADSELVEEYENLPGCNAVYNGEQWTIYFGLPVMTLSDADTEFDEMALLRMIDAKSVRLHQGLVDEMRGYMDGIPEEVRDNFSAPRFYAVWGK